MGALVRGKEEVVAAVAEADGIVGGDDWASPEEPYCGGGGGW